MTDLLLNTIGIGYASLALTPLLLQDCLVVHAPMGMNFSIQR
jgi:hypothetical protein